MTQKDSRGLGLVWVGSVVLSDRDPWSGNLGVGVYRQGYQVDGFGLGSGVVECGIWGYDVFCSYCWELPMESWADDQLHSHLGMMQWRGYFCTRQQVRLLCCWGIIYELVWLIADLYSLGFGNTVDGDGVFGERRSIGNLRVYLIWSYSYRSSTLGQSG